MTKVLYARISEEAHAYVSDLAEQSGMSIAAVTNAILSEALRRGWGAQPVLVLDDLARVREAAQ